MCQSVFSVFVSASHHQSLSWVFSLCDSSPNVFLEKRGIPQIPVHLFQPGSFRIDMVLSLVTDHQLRPQPFSGASQRKPLLDTSTECPRAKLGVGEVLPLSSKSSTCCVALKQPFLLGLSFHLCKLGQQLSCQVQKLYSSEQIRGRIPSTWVKNASRWSQLS